MAIELPQRDPCPFCENVKSRVNADSETVKKLAFVEKQDSAAAFVNPFQTRHGAVLVATTRHVLTILDLEESEAQAVARLVRRVAHGVLGAFDPIGLNVFQNNGVASGQTIPHYHVHVVPRYPGDHPEILLGKDAVLIPFEERVKTAAAIAKHLPD